MNFWKKVDSELVYLGKTRKELASYVGFDAANISFGIKRNSIPAADTALKVSRFLGVSLEYLLDMPEDSQKSEKDDKLLEIESSLRRFSKSDMNAVFSVVSALSEKY